MSQGFRLQLDCDSYTFENTVIVVFFKFDLTRQCSRLFRKQTTSMIYWHDMLTVVCVSNFWWGFCQQISAYLHTKILFRAPDVYLSRDCVCRLLILSCYVLSTLLKKCIFLSCFQVFDFSLQNSSAYRLWLECHVCLILFTEFSTLQSHLII